MDSTSLAPFRYGRIVKFGGLSFSGLLRIVCMVNEKVRKTKDKESVFDCCFLLLEYAKSILSFLFVFN